MCLNRLNFHVCFVFFLIFTSTDTSTLTEFFEFVDPTSAVAPNSVESVASSSEWEFEAKKSSEIFVSSTVDEIVETSSLPFELVSSFRQSEFSSVRFDTESIDLTPITFFDVTTSEFLLESPYLEIDETSATLVDATPTISYDSNSTSVESSTSFYHVTGTIFVSLAANIEVSKQLVESDDSETRVDLEISGAISSNNSCSCFDKSPQHFCPCDALMNVVSIHDLAPLKFFCRTIQNGGGSPFRTSCNVTYDDGEPYRERVPFNCACDVEFRTSFNPSKLECACNDTEIPTTPTPNDCNCTSKDCVCNPCVCHELEIFPKLFIRHSCSCNDTRDSTIINDGNYENGECRRYHFADEMVHVFVNCSGHEEFTTTIKPTPEVRTNCPCEKMSLAGGDVIVLYNCTCANKPNAVAVTEPSVETNVENCKCVEFSFDYGRVKFRVNCTCEKRKDSCSCQGIYVDNKHVVVCLNCTNDESTTTTTTTSTTTAKPVGNSEICIPKCKKAELFDGQISVHFNCSCKQTPTVFYHESSVEIARSVFTECPCGNGMTENTRNLIKRHVLTDRTEPVLFCSCEMREKRHPSTTESETWSENAGPMSESSSTISESSSTMSESPNTIPTSGKTPESSINESLTGGILEKFWIRTVLNTKMENINETKSQIETKLSRAYVEAFRRQHLINLGLGSRNKRQISNNISVEILHIRSYELEKSQTEIIYAVKSGRYLIPAKNAVENFKLLDSEKLEKIMTKSVVLTEEYRKSDFVADSNDGAVVAVAILIPILLVFCLMFICFYYKKKQHKMENQQQVFQESGFVREDSQLKSSAPLIVPPARVRKRNDDGTIKKKKRRKSAETIFSSPSESGKSDDSLVRIKKSAKKNKSKRESPLPLDVHRMIDRHELPRDVFKHVTTPPTKLVRKNKKLAPVATRNLNVKNASSSGISSIGVSKLDVANPIPIPRKSKSSSKSRKNSKIDETESEIESMIRSRSDRVCSAEFLIEDIKNELERYHKTLPPTN